MTLNNYLVLALSAVWFSLPSFGAGFEVAEGEVNQAQLKALEEVAKYDKELFRYSKKVRRYFEVGSDGRKSLIKTEVVIDKEDDGYYFDGNVYYSVTIEESDASTIVSYSYSQGAAFFGDTTALVTPALDVFRTERTCGSDGCAVTSFKNDEAIYKEETH